MAEKMCELRDGKVSTAEYLDAVHALRVLGIDESASEDGVFETNIAVGTRRGHDELAALARQVGSSTKVSPAHIAFNIVIDPSPEGAVGSAYYGIIVRPHEEGQEATGRSWGIYNDRLVKTTDGWRFKYRKYTPGGWEHPEEWAAH